MFILSLQGIQVLSPNHRFEKWLNYPNEYKRLIRFTTNPYTVKNPIVLSGDRHMSELSQKDIGYYHTIRRHCQRYDGGPEKKSIRKQSLPNRTCHRGQ